MIGPKPPSGRGWVYAPAGAFRVPTDIKQEVQRQAQNLIDSILKPRYVQLPDKKAQFNYLVDIHSKWRGPFFYFCSTYCSPGPHALSPSFESKFARMEYLGNAKFADALQKGLVPRWVGGAFKDGIVLGEGSLNLLAATVELLHLLLVGRPILLQVSG